ncbi:glycosyltransferase family 2 protein [Paenibacillus sp. GSMTC-2017]|uniref:glycosyltransferase family 2 protein n=1 Tax=Paenibacillus sp. GSMTC-2017 TaxID=2794350 RepID=UPI0018D6C406|nr:glycosyltransferase family 2 protein [Paenibacillus sp. GSMTC-2017]MBH5319724.1 glycosyltransferase family 2 protein [Paenibacillus sp. GSMTC-2017]
MIEDEDPLISIIIPTYNRAHVISSSIESVIAQTYTNWELIIVSDRCTDHTQKIIDSYSIKDHRIKFAVNNRGKGTSGARNCGMLVAQGEYLSFLDSDDQWYNYHLRDSIDTIKLVNSDVSYALWDERHGDTVYHNYENDTEQNILKELRRDFEVHGDVIVFESGLLERFLAAERHFHCITTMVFRKDLLQNSNLFNEQFGIAEDIAFMISFFDRCRIALITKSHFVYNQSPDSVYMFCDRRQLNPDTLYLDKEVHKKIEQAGLQSLHYKMFLKKMIKNNRILKNKRKLQLISRYALARQYYTLSYINKHDRLKALKYCLQSMRHNVNAFNLLLILHILFPRKETSPFLKKPLNLW